MKQLEAMVIDGINAGKVFSSDAPYIKILKKTEKAVTLTAGTDPTYAAEYFDIYDYHEFHLRTIYYTFWIERSMSQKLSYEEINKYIMNKLLAGFMRVIPAKEF